MFAQKTKIAILGLAISFTLIGCGPAFQANKGKAGPAGILSKTGDAATADSKPKKTPEQLANETQERLKREEAIEKASKEGTVVKSNDIANLYILGVKAAREGEELVFSALVKENSQDNKGSVEIRAKIPVTAAGVPTQVDAAKISLQTIKGAQTLVEPKAEEYTLTSTCQVDCKEVSIHLQRKNETLAYAAEFTFQIAEDKAVGILASSSLKDNDAVTGFDKALVDAGVEVETAGSEATGGEPSATPATSEAPKADAAPAAKDEKPAESAEGQATTTDAATTAAAAEADNKASTDAQETATMIVTESKTTGETAISAARIAANPKANPSKERAQISRDITVKEAVRQRQAVEILREAVKLNGLRSDMMAALADMRNAQLAYANLDKGVANFFATAKNRIDKDLALKKIQEKIAVAKTKNETTKKQIKLLNGMNKDLAAINSELNVLKARLAAAK